MKSYFLITCLTLIANLGRSQCEGFEMTVTLQNPTCHGFTDGSVTMTASGGNSPYNYLLTDTAGTIIVCPDGIGNVLNDGCYIVTVTDSIGCIETDTVCLIDPDPITVDLVITDPTFPGACDGVVLADTVYGYQGGYESIGYFWAITGVALGNEVTDVCAGEYTLTINDEFGCSGVFDFATGSMAEIPVNANREIEVIVNRVKGELVIRNPNGKPLNISLFSLSGQVIYNAEIISEKSIYSPNLKPGIYLYTIGTRQENIKTGKLVF